MAAQSEASFTHTLRYAIPENYGVSLSIIVVLALIIGGKHRLMGAVLGAPSLNGFQSYRVMYKSMKDSYTVEPLLS